jgi:hypothetical protein
MGDMGLGEMIILKLFLKYRQRGYDMDYLAQDMNQ